MTDLNPVVVRRDEVYRAMNGSKPVTDAFMRLLNNGAVTVPKQLAGATDGISAASALADEARSLALIAARPGHASGGGHAHAVCAGTRTASSAGTVQRVPLVLKEARGAALSDDSEGFVLRGGMWQVSMRARFHLAAAGTEEGFLWLTIDGTAVSDSAATALLKHSGVHDLHDVPVHVIIMVKDGAVLKPAWQVTHVNVTLDAEAASGNVPTAPSLTITAVRMTDGEGV